MTMLARLWLALALAAGSVGAVAAGGPAQTAAFWRSAPLTDLAGQPAGKATAFSTLGLVEGDAGRLLVELPDGRQVRAEAEAAVILPGPPAAHSARLERLARANPAPSLARRLVSGRIETGDGQREVDLAWGRPWRSYMVNLFQDEEHYVYRGPAGEPILLRFKGGRLQGAPPPGPPWVAGVTPAR